MSVEIFDLQQFESALPVNKNTRAPLWTSLGIIHDEYTYLIRINKDIGIVIRSSIDASGLSANTGEDSIRCWLVDAESNPLGSKVSKWITRIPGWQKRMTGNLRILWGMAIKAGYCPDCQIPKGVYKVKKQTANKGRLFSKCRNEDCPNPKRHFTWITEVKK